MSASMYDVCSAQVDSDMDLSEQNQAMIRCLAEQYDSAVSAMSGGTGASTYTADDVANGLDTFFIIYAASLVFFMQAGFAMLCAGSVRIKNVQNTMLKNLLDACGAALGFYSVGYAFAYGGTYYGGPTTFIGNANFFLIGVDDLVFWLFQFAFAATAATIVAGTLAERCQMTAYLCYSLMLTGFVYPVIVHAVWSTNGFLSPHQEEPLWGSGMIDFAGSGVVHATGGITALIATRILGSRKGRFYDERGNVLSKPKPFPGHSVALQVLGSFILWFGWYGFNTGSTQTVLTAAKARVAALAATNTTLAAAGGGVAALFTNLVIMERYTGEAIFNLNFAMNGCLAGLVSITSGCAVMEPWAGIVTGIVAGLLYLWFSRLLVKLRIDDAVDAIPVHMINGVWGLIATGLMAAPGRMLDAYGTQDHVGWFYEWGRGSANFTLMGCQLVGICFIVGWVTVLMMPFFLLLNYMGWFRSDALEEVVGLDISYHGGSSNNVGEVKSEYLDAFRKRRDEQIRQRSGQRFTTGGGGGQEQHRGAVEATADMYDDDMDNGNVDRVTGN